MCTCTSESQYVNILQSTVPSETNSTRSSIFSINFPNLLTCFALFSAPYYLKGLSLEMVWPDKNKPPLIIKPASACLNQLHSRNTFLKVWWFDATLFVYLYFYRLRHTFITYKLQLLRPTPLSSLLLLRRGISLVVPSRESNPGLPYSKPTHYFLSYAAP